MKKTCAKILIMALVLQSVYLTVNVTNESAKAATLNLHNPTMINGVSTWDCVYFGTYWQNDTNEDGVADQNDAKEPIKWRVLQVDGDDVFLMSDKNILALFTHCLVARKEDACKYFYIEGFTEK